MLNFLSPILHTKIELFMHIRKDLIVQILNTPKVFFLEIQIQCKWKKHMILNSKLALDHQELEDGFCGFVMGLVCKPTHVVLRDREWKQTFSIKGAFNGYIDIESWVFLTTPLLLVDKFGHLYNMFVYQMSTFDYPPTLLVNVVVE